MDPFLAKGFENFFGFLKITMRALEFCNALFILFFRKRLVHEIVFFVTQVGAQKTILAAGQVLGKPAVGAVLAVRGVNAIVATAYIETLIASFAVIGVRTIDAIFAFLEKLSVITIFAVFRRVDQMTIAAISGARGERTIVVTHLHEGQTRDGFRKFRPLIEEGTIKIEVAAVF